MGGAGMSVQRYTFATLYEAPPLVGEAGGVLPGWPITRIEAAFELPALDPAVVCPIPALEIPPTNNVYSLLTVHGSFVRPAPSTYGVVIAQALIARAPDGSLSIVGPSRAEVGLTPALLDDIQLSGEVIELVCANNEAVAVRSSFLASLQSVSVPWEIDP